MIREEYYEAGFPICATVPVICVRDDFKVLVAYSKFELVRILQENKVKCCHGIWPGKKMSDCFILDPEKYVKTLIPPEDHKEIDNASEITLCLDTDCNFIKVSYLPRNSDVVIETKNQLVLDYLKKAGIRYATVFE